MRFLIPQGIGDVLWALLKIQSVAKTIGDGNIDVFVTHLESDHRESRAMGFLKRFDFIRSVGKLPVPISLPGAVADEQGYFRYIKDGPRFGEVDYALMPNTPLERGIRIENWLPEFETNWKIMDDFLFKNSELRYVGGHCRYDEYCVFFLGSEAGNTTSGHNRGPVWKPEDWMNLVHGVKMMYPGLRVLIVGADYDLSYYTKYIEPQVSGWENMIGSLPIGSTIALLQKAKFVISYQSGIGVAAAYMGVPTGMFWRAKGDSIIKDIYVSFEEEMASAWVPPEMLSEGKYMPLIYGRHGVNYILGQLQDRSW